MRRGAFAGCGPAADTSSAEGRRNERQRKRHQKSEFALFQTSLPLFQLFYFVKCWRFFQELKSKGLYLSSQKKKNHPVVLCLRPPQNVKLGSFTCSSCTVTAKKCTKKRDARAKLLFASLLPFCRSRCRRRCLSSLLSIPRGSSVKAA